MSNSVEPKPSDAPTLRHLATGELTAHEIETIRALMTAAFGDDAEERFEDADWDHALGGTHVVVDVNGQIVAHAAVVAREIHVAGRPLRTGYIEAVATAPDHHGMGLGTQVMEAINAIIRERFELGVLGTGSHHFYERLGWRTWRGPSFVRTAEGDQRTSDDDGYILVPMTPTTPPIDLDASISCEWRPGDVW